MSQSSFCLCSFLLNQTFLFLQPFSPNSNTFVGVYRRSNLNLPAWLPPRADYLDYVLDSPITQVGLFVSAETGRALAEAGVQFTVCYSSPSLRCVQTACELLRAMGRVCELYHFMSNTRIAFGLDSRWFRQSVEYAPKSNTVTHLNVNSLIKDSRGSYSARWITKKSATGNGWESTSLDMETLLMNISK